MKRLLVLLILLMTISGCGGVTKSEAVVELESLISEMGPISLGSASLIQTIDEKYALLSDTDKKTVDNYDTFVDAKETYSELKFVELVDGLGEITLSNRKDVYAARKAYDSMSDGAKAKVDAGKLQALKDAEAKVKKLRDAKIKERVKGYRKSKDSYSGVTFYEPKRMPKYINVRTYFLPYISYATESKFPTLITRAIYFGSDWIFWENLYVKVDGKSYSFTPGYYNVTRDNQWGDVWEYYDIICSDDEVEMLRAIANSKKAVVRFEGDNYYKNFTIGAKDKTAIKHILYTYDLMMERFLYE